MPKESTIKTHSLKELLQLQSKEPSKLLKEGLNSESKLANNNTELGLSLQIINGQGQTVHSLTWETKDRIQLRVEAIQTCKLMGVFLTMQMNLLIPILCLPSLLIWFRHLSYSPSKHKYKVFCPYKTSSIRWLISTQVLRISHLLQLFSSFLLKK